MRKTRQRVIHALCCEERQRTHTIFRHIGPIDDVVICGRQIRHIKDVTQGETRSPFLWNGQSGAGGDREMHRHWCSGHADGHGLVVVFDQQSDLLLQIVTEQIRSCHRGGIGARIGYMAKAQTAIHLCVGRGGEANLWVKGAHAAAGRGPGAHCGDEFITQEIGRAVIKLNQAGNGGFCVGKALSVGKGGGVYIIH